MLLQIQGHLKETYASAPSQQEGRFFLANPALPPGKLRQEFNRAMSAAETSCSSEAQS